MSRLIVEKSLNGSLEVTNTGAGACFTITAPVAKEI